ncbi:MAG: addiction module protein [Nostoc sp.]|uniref:addiction module protein n=1 Tax=Nostoc sp. TaxID=1180 RepID=UPI002FF92529
MTLEQLEAVPKDSQVILLARLLERLGQESGIDQEIAASWAEEAQKRDEDMNTNQITGIPAEEVFQRVRASLQSKELYFIHWQSKSWLMSQVITRNKDGK